MKKIALLFSIVCFGQMYGMEPEQCLGNLPKEIHHEIIRHAIESSNTIEDTIKAINVACVLQGACYNNLKSFTQLVHVLANKFNTSTEQVAKKFNTSLSSQYVTLANKLKTAIPIAAGQSDKCLIDVINLIKDGADVNATFSVVGNESLTTTPLMVAINKVSLPIVTLLLNSGANPTFNDLAEATNKDNEINKKSYYYSSNEIESASTIKEMIENAMQKYN